LTDAAAAGRRDPLVSLKENVIMGHLIPAGTGFKIHQDIELVKEAPDFLLPVAEKPKEETKVVKETKKAKETKEAKS
jgi:DNA-directed RNA polymerase subunit beta'